MIVRILCAECDEPIHVVRSHQGDESTWGAIILSEVQQKALRGALRCHRGDACRHFAALKSEALDRLLDNA